MSGESPCAPDHPSDCVPWHCSLAFYRGFRPAHVTGAVDASSTRTEEDVFIISLHKRLLPPSDVSEPLDHDYVNEHYSQQLSSDEGLEFLRLNWCLLLALLFPYGGSPGTSAEVDRRADDKDQMKERGLTEAQRTARNEATTQTPVSGTEACDAGPLSPVDNAVIRDPGTLDRVYFSFIVFLRFFGWRVHDEQRGVLDRHRGWERRYRRLEPGAGRTAPATQITGDGVQAHAEALRQLHQALNGAAPTYDGDVNFYEVALSRILSSLLSVGLVLFAIRLVEFLLDEMKASRLVALLSLVEQRWLPLLEAHVAVDPSHTKRLRKKLHRLTHSDSD